MYEKYYKRIIDLILSSTAMMVLSGLFLVIVIAVVFDDPGPVFFKQKRVGKGKTLFFIHKFRSMKVITPPEVPTHMLNHSERYVTGVGRFLRKFGLDELPQLWDIFIGNMSIVGPRPALWNQYDLIDERDKFGANDIMPGLTGWAQINGGAELDIPVKAKWDGDYTRALHEGGFKAFCFDLNCMMGTVSLLLRRAGLKENGTGRRT